MVVICHVLLLFVMSDCRVVSNGFSGGGSFSMPGAYVCEKNKGSGRMNRRVVASSFVTWGLKFKSTPAYTKLRSPDCKLGGRSEWSEPLIVRAHECARKGKTVFQISAFWHKFGP